MHARRRRLILGLALLLLIGVSLAAVWGYRRRRPSNAHTEPPEVVGFVLNCTPGAWLRDARPPQTLAVGDKLYLGETIRPTDTSAGASLDVCYFDGKEETLRKETSFPEAKKPGFPDRLWTALTANYRPIAAAPISRGGPVLTDGPCRLSAGRLELAPALKAKPKGLLLVELERIQLEAKIQSDGPTIKRRFEWDPAVKPALDADQVKPGLYVMRLLDTATELPTGAECWILIAQAADYDALRQRYEEVCDRVEKSWGDEVSFKNKRNFLRAYLSALAETPAR